VPEVTVQLLICTSCASKRLRIGVELRDRLHRGVMVLLPVCVTVYGVVGETNGGVVSRWKRPSIRSAGRDSAGNTYTSPTHRELAGRFHSRHAAIRLADHAIHGHADRQQHHHAGVKTIAQLNANPESFEAPTRADQQLHGDLGHDPVVARLSRRILTVTDGTGSFQLKWTRTPTSRAWPRRAAPSPSSASSSRTDFLRPFDSGYDVAPRSRVDLGGPPPAARA